jgi:hypothetical protein
LAKVLAWKFDDKEERATVKYFIRFPKRIRRGKYYYDMAIDFSHQFEKFYNVLCDGTTIFNIHPKFEDRKIVYETGGERWNRSRDGGGSPSAGFIVTITGKPTRRTMREMRRAND